MSGPNQPVRGEALASDQLGGGWRPLCSWFAVQSAHVAGVTKRDATRQQKHFKETRRRAKYGQNGFKRRTGPCREAVQPPSSVFPLRVLIFVGVCFLLKFLSVACRLLFGTFAALECVLCVCGPKNAPLISVFILKLWFFTRLFPSCLLF